jgi:ribonuclease P protein component
VKVTFSREHRIITKKEFKHIFDKAEKISQKHLFILYKPNQMSSARLGLSIGKRIAKSAVVRNRIKRIVRESFRYHRMHLKQMDIVVIARKPCDTLSKQQLREGIDKLWEKLGNIY